MIFGGIVGAASGGMFTGASEATAAMISGTVSDTVVAGAISGAAGGATAGAFAGGMNAAYYGGDIGRGVLMGGLIGAATGAVSGAIKGYYDGETPGDTGGPQESLCTDPSKNTSYLEKNVDGVDITYERSVLKRPVDITLKEDLEAAISVAKEENPGLTSLSISSTSEAGRTGCHKMGYAIDLNKVNGMRIIDTYGTNGFVKSVVGSLQSELFSSGSYLQINLGPAMQYMSFGSVTDALANQHLNHIHYCVIP